MIKLNEVIHGKLQLQADEAEERGMIKLAEAVKHAITNTNEIITEYSLSQMNDDIHKDLWKIATKLIAFHNVESTNIEKLDQTLISWASKIIDDLEKTLQINNNIKGALEPKLPGEIT